MTQSVRSPQKHFTLDDKQLRVLSECQTDLRLSQIKHIQDLRASGTSIGRILESQNKSGIWLTSRPLDIQRQTAHSSPFCLSAAYYSTGQDQCADVSIFPETKGADLLLLPKLIRKGSELQTALKCFRSAGLFVLLGAGTLGLHTGDSRVDWNVLALGLVLLLGMSVLVWENPSRSNSRRKQSAPWEMDTRRLERHGSVLGPALMLAFVLSQAVVQGVHVARLTAREALSGGGRCTFKLAFAFFHLLSLALMCNLTQ